MTGVTVCYGILAAALRQFEEGGSVHNRIVVTVIDKQLNNKTCSNKTRNCDLNRCFVPNKNIKIIFFFLVALKDKY